MNALIRNRVSSDLKGNERKLMIRMPTKSDFISKRIKYRFICGYPRYAYIFTISPDSVSVMVRCAGGSHFRLSSGTYWDSLGLLAEYSDLEILFDLRVLGLFKLVSVIRNRQKTYY